MSHLKTYPEYKDSGVEWIGQIPEQWEVKKYKRTFTFINGHGFPHNLQGDKKGDKPFLKVSDISFKGKYVKKSSNYVSDLTIKLNKWNEIEPYSILTAKIGEALRKNHRKINIVPCIIDNNMMGLTPSIEDNLDYLYYVLNVVDLDWYSNPGAVPSVNNRHFREDFLMIPSYQEQIKISHYLIGKTTEIDNLISGKEHLIELLEEKRQAVITETVTKGLDPNVEMKDSGIEWIGDIPEHWDIIKLKHITKMKSGNFINANDIHSAGEYKVYGGGGLRGYTSSYTHESNHVLIGRQGALCGNITFASGKFWATEHAITVKTENSNIEWLRYLMEIMDLNQYSMSAAQPGLSVNKISNLPIPVPSREEQKKIAHKIKTYDTEIKKINKKINQQIFKLKEYRESLIYEAVTGKIDVRDYKTNEMNLKIENHEEVTETNESYQ